MDPEIQKDYLLLRNYLENVFTMRGILLKDSMNSLKNIQNDTFSLVTFRGIEKIKLESVFQMDIISKIMMYIEDLIIISESFRIETPYYKLLDISDENEKDVGKIIKYFFKNVNSFSDEDFFKIMSYVDPEQLDLEENEKNLVKKNIELNILELKRIFNQIGDFGKTNHPVFRRFKHAGAPLVPGAISKDSKSTPLSNFDSYTMVSIGSDPFENVIPIPFSEDIWDGYSIIIRGIQLLLKDMLTHRIACIERNLTGIIPNEYYSPKDFSEEEVKNSGKIFENFCEKNPSNITDELKNFNFKVDVKKEEIAWYLNLPEFLKECKQRKEENTDLDNSLL